MNQSKLLVNGLSYINEVIIIIFNTDYAQINVLL